MTACVIEFALARILQQPEAGGGQCPRADGRLLVIESSCGDSRGHVGHENTKSSTFSSSLSNDYET